MLSSSRIPFSGYVQIWQCPGHAKENFKAAYQRTFIQWNRQLSPAFVCNQSEQSDEQTSSLCFTGDDVCGICRAPFDGCPPDAKFPGDDSAVVWGKCNHSFHLQCINKWLSTANNDQKCPFCRRPWEFKAAATSPMDES